MAALSLFLSALGLFFGYAAALRRAGRGFVDRAACSDKDVSGNCGNWAGLGYCSQSSQFYRYMARNCCQSCGFGPAPTPAPAPPAAGTCGFVTEPVQTDVGGGYRGFVYTEPYRASFFTDGLLLNDTAFQQYTSWLTDSMARNFGDVDPFNQTALLIRQRDVFARHGFDTWEWDVMLNGNVGAITAANCIESALWAKQNEYHPLMDDASEYGAYILLDSANTTVKVYLQTGPEPMVPSMSWAFPSISQDLKNGFQMLTFLHNHPFFAKGGIDCAGTCVPSSPDLRAFASDRNLMSSAQSFWITNGHDSFRFPSSELGMFTPAGMFGQHVQMEHPEGPLDSVLGARMERPEGPLDLLSGAKS